MSKPKLTRSEKRALERKKLKSQSKEKSSAPKIKSNNKWYMPVVAVIITFICFSNVGQLGFTNWDDDRNTYENASVVNFSMDHFGTLTKDIFTTHVIGNYNPLTTFSFAMDKVMHGIDNPGPWHWENLLLHIICVFFVYRICILLGLKWQGSLFVALLFGIHPMRVESVTWITERKDVLFGVFFLSALYFYIKNKAKPSILNIVLITGLFILSLLSKIQAVTLPLTMLAVDYYLDDKMTIKHLVSKAHYFALSLITGLVGIHFLGEQGSLNTNETFVFGERIFIGAYSYIIYLVKSVIPFRLSPLYPYPSDIPWYFYVSIIIAPILLYGLWKFHKLGKKHLVFGLIFFTFNIMFLLQILGAGQGFLADRFTYIAYFGLFFIAGYYLNLLVTKKHKWAKAVIAASGIYLLVMGFMTYQQNKIWENSGTLWTHVLKYYKKSTLPYGNRANYYRDAKQYDLALADYSSTLSLKPDNPEALNSRGRLYFNLGGKDNMSKAMADYSQAISLMEAKSPSPERNKSLGEFYINKGATYAMLGRNQEAIAEIDKGLKLKPSHQAGYLNRSVLYNQQGNYSKALEDIETYFTYNPYNADLWYESARLKRALNRVPEAIDDYTQAIKLNRQKGIYYYERSRTYHSLGNIEAAKNDLGNAIQLNYKKIDPNYRSSLGM